MPKSDADYKEKIIRQGVVSPNDIAQFGLGDADFDADRNRRIIADTVKKTNENYKRKRKLLDDGLQERSHFLANYIEHITNNNSDMPVEKYAGWKQAKTLWGEARRDELQKRALLQGYSIK